MNRLFLLIPAVNDEDAGQDIAYLKLLGDVDSEQVVAILRGIVKSLNLVEEEDTDILYDAMHLKRLMSDKMNAALQEMPQKENLLLFLNDATSIQEIGIGNMTAIINGMTVDKGLVNAFLEDGTTSDALLNKDALLDSRQPIEVLADKGRRHQLNALPCDAAEVYLWLVGNRNPHRQLDPNYKKHGPNDKFGKRRVVVSPLTYTEQQLEQFLKRAVVAKKGLRELYFKDNEKDKIVIFWDENLQAPSYHAMEIEADNLEEIQKMYKRGGRALVDRIEATSRLIEQG